MTLKLGKIHTHFEFLQTTLTVFFRHNVKSFKILRKKHASDVMVNKKLPRLFVNDYWEFDIEFDEC